MLLFCRSDNVQACGHIDRKALAAGITRKRSDVRPPVPTELLEVEKYLIDTKYIKFTKTKDGKDVFHRGVVGDAGHRSIVLGSQRVCNWYSGQMKAGVDG